MSLPMALVDFLPVGLFLAAAILLQRELYPLMSKGAFALFSAGTITVFVAGLFKGIWKLLMALSLCDFEALNRCFFPMQTVGFVLAACGVIGDAFPSAGRSAECGAARVCRDDDFCGADGFGRFADGSGACDPVGASTPVCLHSDLYSFLCFRFGNGISIL